MMLLDPNEAERAIEMLAAIVESSDDAIASKDLNGILTSWNRGAERLFGYTAAEAIGKPVTILIPENRVNEEPEILSKIKQGERIDHYETVRRCKDGSLVDISLTVSPIKDRTGNIIGASKIARDITEKKKTEAALQHVREMAEAANRSKERFLAVLSHELRTPLTPVLMLINEWQEDQAIPEELREALEMMRRNIELETKLIDDMLDLSRINSAKMVIRPEPRSLNDTVLHACETCKLEIQRRDIQLHLHLDVTIGTIQADPGRLQQVLCNVLKNAAKFTPPRGEIVVSTCRERAGKIKIIVRDSGIGIPPEKLPTIFDPFEQGGSEVTKHFGGLGLGLAISKAIVELHHGSILIESEGEGKGTTLIIELPELAPPETLSVVSVPAESSARPLRILLVEDHLDTASTAVRLLEKRGHTVNHAPTQAQAKELASQSVYDLVVCDVGLPDGTGYELMEALKELYPSMTGIAVSGYGTKADIEKSRAACFSHHLTKPLDFAALEQVIRECS